MSKIIQKIKLPRTDKILLTIYKLTKNGKCNIIFEDIVVQLFMDYKEDFHLRGYIKYPDSEGVNKAIYSNLRKGGLVTYGNKVFTLTDKGLVYARNLKYKISNKKVFSTDRLVSSNKNEINRIKKLQGYNLFMKNEKSKIIDTDFYNYIGVSVKTPKDQILGRIKALDDIYKDKINENNVEFIKLVKYHKFLLNKFSDLINYYKLK